MSAFFQFFKCPASCSPSTTVHTLFVSCVKSTGIVVLLALVGLVVAGAFLLGKRGRRLDAMRADAAVRWL